MMNDFTDAQQPETILVAVDGSHPARSAAKAAIQVAKSQHLIVQGLYVVDGSLALDAYADPDGELEEGQAFRSSEEVIDRFEAQGQQALEWLTEQCQAADVLAAVDLWLGGITDAIVDKASQAAWLALGRRGNRHTSDPEHLGRHFREVAHHVRLPTLVGGDEYRPVKHILLVYDGSQRARDALTWTLLLQRDFQAKVTLLVVAEHDNVNEAESWLEEERSHIPEPDLVNFTFLMQSGDAPTQIAAVAAQSESDLIVMEGYQHAGLAEWLVGSTLDRVLRTTSLPVLVV